VARLADGDERHNRLREAWSRGDREALERIFDDGGDLDLPPTTAWLVGAALLGAGSVDRAEQLLRRGQQARPNDFFLNQELYELLSSVTGRRQQAVGFLRAALAARPDSAGAHYSLAMALASDNRGAEAIIEYQTVLRLQPDFTRARQQLATLQKQTEQATAELGKSRRVFTVNTRRISLSYDLLDAGRPEAVLAEVFCTQDYGRTWYNCGEQTSSEPRFTITVDHEGLYGFAMVARNRAGSYIDRPPMMGDQPQVWVQVDTTRPLVCLKGTEPGRGALRGTLIIYYEAKDDNLTAHPITLSWAEKSEGPWVPIAGNEENTGRFIWRIPENLPHQVRLRLEAVDRAGNVGSAETTEVVPTDLLRLGEHVLGTSDSGDPLGATPHLPQPQEFPPSAAGQVPGEGSTRP
jgi:hypothetical protein